MCFVQQYSWFSKMIVKNLRLNGNEETKLPVNQLNTNCKTRIAIRNKMEQLCSTFHHNFLFSSFKAHTREKEKKNEIK